MKLGYLRYAKVNLLTPNEEMTVFIASCYYSLIFFFFLCLGLKSTMEARVRFLDKVNLFKSNYVTSNCIISHDNQIYKMWIVHDKKSQCGSRTYFHYG